MTDPVSPAAIAAIVAKRDEILKERADIRAKSAALSMRDRELDRELADCRAAARLFGAKIEFPADDTPIIDGQRRFVASWRTLDSAQHIAPVTGSLSVKPATAKSAHTEKALAAIQEALNLAEPSEMPRISDVVLDRLKAAGKNGTKAAPIQRYIESTYGKKIHDKTVGMTLYRLAKDELVQRDGHTWFITEKGMNPGAVTPGQINKAN
jgi:hypothetical protein